MLLHHWKYFVPSKLAPGRGSSVTVGAQQHFLQLLQTVGACFESEAASPALYGYNLVVRTTSRESFLLLGALLLPVDYRVPLRMRSSIRQVSSHPCCKGENIRTDCSAVCLVVG